MGRGATNQGANTVRRNQGATINYCNIFKHFHHLKNQSIENFNIIGDQLKVLT
jgi:hypothetical protein